MIFCVDFYTARTPEALIDHLAGHGLKLAVPTRDFLPSHKDLVDMSMAVERTCSSIALFKICEVLHLWNILNVEFIDSLAEYLQVQTGPIVEVCAGDGTLSHWLGSAGIAVRPTDADTSKNNHYIGIDTSQYVEQIDALEAMDKYKPRIVLASWIPYRSTLAEELLAHPSVQRLIYIGEGYGGCCGSEELWQYPHEELPATEFVVSRTDFHFTSGLAQHGVCVEFRKMPQRRIILEET